MKDLKPPPVNLDAVSTSGGGGGCGCVLGGCAIAAFAMMFLCVGSYYGVMHTSLPLTMIERGLEEDGKIRIDGLSGSISKGFEIDRLEFEGYGGHWSELRGVKFQFNGIYDFASNQRFIIEQATVESGTIYAELEEPEDFEPGMDADWSEEFAEGIDEVHQEYQDEDVQGLDELRIDLMRVKNLTIINPDTELTLKIDRAEFKDFQMIDGQITNLGNIDVKSDHLDLDSRPSDRYDGGKLSWHLDGTLKKEMHTKILEDIPFEVDIVIRKNNKVESFVNMFDGKLTTENAPDSEFIVHLHDLSPGEYFTFDTPLIASNWNLHTTTTKEEEWEEVHPVSTEAEVDNSAEAEEDIYSSENQPYLPTRRLVTTHTMNIDPENSFVLGNATFVIQTEIAIYQRGRGEQVRPEIIATTDADDSIRAYLEFDDNSPFVEVELRSDDGRDPRELWSQLFFEKDYASLSPEDQTSVDIALGEDPEDEAMEAEDESALNESETATESDTEDEE